MIGRREFSIHAKALGLPGWLGMLLSGVALMGWLWWLPALELEAEMAGSQVDDTRARLGTLSPRTQDATKPSSADWRTTWARTWVRLPAAEQATSLQAEVLADASRRGLQVQSVRFKGSAVPGIPGLWRQQIELPVQATYPALQAWLTAVQHEPGLSIDALDITREGAMAEQVKARVALSLWWRESKP